MIKKNEDFLKMNIQSSSGYVDIPICLLKFDIHTFKLSSKSN